MQLCYNVALYYFDPEQYYNVVQQCYNVAQLYQHDIKLCNIDVLLQCNNDFKLLL